MFEDLPGLGVIYQILSKYVIIVFSSLELVIGSGIFYYALSYHKSHSPHLSTY